VLYVLQITITQLQELAMHRDRRPSGLLTAMTRRNSPTFVVCHLTNWVIQNRQNVNCWCTSM